MADNNAKKTTASNAKQSTTAAAPAPTESVLTASSLPSAADLKARFKAGSIPLQSDFADLIDMANTGRLAVGDNGPGKGMRLSSTGQLEPDITTFDFKNDPVGCSPVKVNTDTNQIVVDVHYGLIDEGSGLGVKAGNAINVDKDGIAVKVENNRGLQVTSNGISVKTGNGINVNNDGVQLKLAKGEQNNGGGGAGLDGQTSGSAGGLWLDSNGLSVNAGDGIQINTRGVSIKLANDSGLSADEGNGLGLNKLAWLRTMSGLHNADFYAEDPGATVFFCNIESGCVAYVYGRAAKYISTNKNLIALNKTGPFQVLAMIEPGSDSSAATMIAWERTTAKLHNRFLCEIKSFIDDKSSFNVDLQLKAVP